MWISLTSPGGAGETPAPRDGEAGAAKAFALLTSAMKDADPDVRALAAGQWGRIGSAAAKGPLRAALRDDSPYVRLAAAKSLRGLGDAGGVGTVESIVARAPKLPEKGKALGAAEEMRFIKINKVRVAAARTLGEISKSTSSAAVLRKTFSEPDGTVRDAAAVALARMGAGEGLEDFVAALEAEDPAVRAQAAAALGDAGSADYAGAVSALADDPEPRVRSEAMAALGRIGSGAALSALRKGLGDEDELVRSKAIESLGMLGLREALPWLRAARESAPNVYVRLLAISAGARLGGRGEGDVEAAQRALSQKDADTRLLAVECLEALGGEGGVKENLEAALEDGDARVRVRAAGALLKLFRDGRGGDHAGKDKGR